MSSDLVLTDQWCLLHPDKSKEGNPAQWYAVPQTTEPTLCYHRGDWYDGQLISSEPHKDAVG